MVALSDVARDSGNSVGRAGTEGAETRWTRWVCFTVDTRALWEK